MAKTEKDKQLEQAAKLLDTLADLQRKLGDILVELHKVLGGEASIGALMRRASDYYLMIWQERYASKYAWQGAKDSVQLGRLVRLLDIVDLEDRMWAYLRDDDAFHVKARHPFALFAANVNRYARARPTEVADPNWWQACHHEPRCDTRLRHTVRVVCDEDKARVASGAVPSQHP